MADFEDELSWEDIAEAEVPLVPPKETDRPSQAYAEQWRAPLSGLVNRRAEAGRTAAVRRRKNESKASQSRIVFVALIALGIGLIILFLALKNGRPAGPGASPEEPEAVGTP